MNNEMLAMLEYLENDRGIQRDALVAIIEEALASSAKKVLGMEHDVAVRIDPKTGDIRAFAQLTVVDGVRRNENEIALKDVQRKHPAAKAGDVVEWEVTPANFGRIAAQTAKQTIMQKLRQAEKVRVAEENKEKLGQLVVGVVRKIEKGDVFIDFHRAEGIMRHSDRIPGEDYQVGDHITALLVGVNADKPGPCLEVSRAHPDFVRCLFEREVSEISEGLVTIKAVAREPGYRSKIAVDSTEPRVDPVGACVGVKGMRVKNIVRELAGEKVDIIRWGKDVSTFVENALQPAKLTGVQVDTAAGTVRVTVPEDQLSLAIGKRGQNARLAAKLTGWKIDINRVEKQETEELSFEDRVHKATETLAAVPGIGAETAAALVQNGFLTLEGILAAEAADLAGIEGIDAARAEEILAIARQQCGV
jgi:N utilization substance protein A